jgi:hypothetical protein
MIYLAAPYSNVSDKDSHMNQFVKYAGEFMEQNPGLHLISPLYHHWTLKQVPTMGTDYKYWRDFSRDLLKRCDSMIVLKFPGWVESIGVRDEIDYAEELGKDVIYIEV